MERGDIILIGATTENPSFEVISALLSRAKVYVLRPLTEEEIVGAAAGARCRWWSVDASDELLRADRHLRQRRCAHGLQHAGTSAAAAAGRRSSPSQAVEDSLQRKMLLYDKAGEEHFNLISALHKSVRSSDVDAALYWLGRMLEAGEDRLYIARRLVRMAIEDIGLADPRALEQSIAAMQAVHFLGIPEGDLALAQAAIYLIGGAEIRCRLPGAERRDGDVEKQQGRAGSDASAERPHRAMKQWGYGAGYQHAHSLEDALPDMECLPEYLVGTGFYKPTKRGLEQQIGERFEEIRARKANPAK